MAPKQPQSTPKATGKRANPEVPSPDQPDAKAIKGEVKAEAVGAALEDIGHFARWPKVSLGFHGRFMVPCEVGLVPFIGTEALNSSYAH